MLFIKNKRYKPLYKKFIRLRKNVQYRKKLLKSRITFKKQKWSKLIIYLKRRTHQRGGKRNYNLLDQSKIFIQKFGASFKRKFSENLITKQKFGMFYGHLSEKSIKQMVNIALNKVKTNKLIIDPTLFLLELLETRLDTVLYRSHFLLSLKGAHQLIVHGNIKVNGVVVKKKSFRLKEGDLVEVIDKAQKKIHNNVKNWHLWPMPPKHLQINYKTLQIIYVSDVKLINYATCFPFKMDFKSIIRLYNY